MHQRIPRTAGRWAARAIGAGLGLCLTLAAAAAEGSYESPGAKRMGDRLREIARTNDVMKNIFQNDGRAEWLGRALTRATNAPERLDLTGRYAVELLSAGRTEEAIAEFGVMEKLMREQGKEIYDQNRQLYLSYLAISYLRQGEQQNCLLNHNAASCLAPIQGDGVHKLQAGSRHAIEVLEQLLKDYPDDLSSRWLLNIAYMTVGEYPAKVPERWLVPPKAFDSDYDIKRFPEVAGGLGLDVNRRSGGVIMDDFDGDGNLDLIMSSIGFADSLRYFHNNGDGTFADWTDRAGLLNEFGGLNLIQADYNNDGFLDVLVLRGAWMKTAGHFPVSLLRNNGNGTFDDVTEEAGLLRFRPTQTAVWFDFNNDGWLDLFIGNESSKGDRNPCELFRNNGDGTFTECAAACGVANVGFVKGVVSADFNNDGRPDLYLSRLGQPNVLYRNDGPKDPSKGSRGDWAFTDVAAQAGVTEPMYSFPCWFFDYDNDGWPDIFVAGYHITDAGDIAADYLGLPSAGERARLYHNNRDGTFTDASMEAGLSKVLHAMGCNFGDLDNDGYLDFYLGTGDPNLSTLVPNRMFRNAGGKVFQDVTTSGGFGHLQKGHAVAFGDIDNDGDQDVYEVMGGAYTGDTAFNVLFENPGHGNHWITLKLEGVQSNRGAIGARIKVIAETADGPREIHRTVGSGGSFGANPLRQEIGLGEAKAIRAVEIFWPVTGQTQALKNLPMDHFYRVREGAAEATPWDLKSFKLAVDPAKAHMHHHPGAGTASP